MDKERGWDRWWDLRNMAGWSLCWGTQGSGGVSQRPQALRRSPPGWATCLFLFENCFQGTNAQGHCGSCSRGTAQGLAPAKHLHVSVPHRINSRLQPGTGNPVSSISASGWASSPILPKDTRLPLKIPAFLGRASTANCTKYVRVSVTALIVRGVPETTPLSSKHFSSRGKLVQLPK